MGKEVQTSRRQFLASAARAVGSCAVLSAAACKGSGQARVVPCHTWGVTGKHRGGEFHRPRAISATADRVYVADKTGRVQVFDHSGAYLLGWSVPEHENGTPTCVREFEDGRVIIPDTHYSRILEYTTEGEMLTQWGSYGTAEDQFIYPTCICLAGDGCYYISEYGMDAERVHVFDANRKFLRQWGEHGDSPGEFSRSMALEVNADGVVWVADTGNHRLQTFSPKGKLLRVIDGAGALFGPISYPYDISLAPDETILVCEYGNNRISRYDDQGHCLGCVGVPGREPGEFNAPRGVAVSPDGKVFVADTDNDRIQRFELEELS